MRPAALLGVLAVAVLGGCAPQLATSQPTVAPSASASAHEQAPGNPHLRAEGRVFDPVSDDVPGVEACDGSAGRETLDTFDRAAWPDLEVAAGTARLTCGNADGAGWRHIADGHTDDFAELADLVGAGWEDVAWFAIDRALEQPTRVEAYRDDIVNYDVLVELADGDRAERSWIVTVGVGLGSGQIITSFPDEQR